jgi:hypothetical protein
MLRNAAVPLASASEEVLYNLVPAALQMITTVVCRYLSYVLCDVWRY